MDETRAEDWVAIRKDRLLKAKDLALEGLLIDEGHHKQWYLERILEALGYGLNQLRHELLQQKQGSDWKEGIAP